MKHDKEGLIIGYHDVPIDETILNKLAAFRIDKQDARKYIKANNHNHITTTYYLLL